MKLKIALSTATAIGLLMGAAWADENISVIRQTGGNGNSASVGQSGTSNVIKFTQDGNNNSVDVTQSGSANNSYQHIENNSDGLDDSGDTASTYNYVSQHGDDNALSLTQTGRVNNVGVNGHVLQSGNRNEATITQKGGTGNIHGGGGSVNLIEQTDTVGASTGTTNKLTIRQQAIGSTQYSDGVHYANEYIYSVKQTNKGGALNELTLTQKGIDESANNEIYSAVQSGAGNTGDVTQSGRTNFLRSLSQTGSGNNASIGLAGTNNGASAGAHVGTAFSSAAASVVGVEQATATQNGSDNTLFYSANGDSNQFGFAQAGVGIATGDDNDISGTTVDNNNQVAVGQWGSNNNTMFSQSGDANDLGVAIYGDDNGRGGFRTNSAAAGLNLTNGDVTQSGGGNMASVTIGDGTTASSSNNYAAKQTGGNNQLTLAMAGGGENNIAVKQNGDDVATVKVTGGRNVIGAQQLGGGTSTLTVTLFGSSNNWAGGFSGDAAGVGLTTPGAIYQNGDGSVITLNVGVDAGNPSNSNLFAFKQTGGDDNVISGTIKGGDGNQVAVLQNGTNNYSSFLQNGSGNNIGVKQ
jgi:hypothetical protein